MKNYTEDAIKEAIDHYETILHSDKYYWSHKWTLEEFLQRGLDRLLPDQCLDNYILHDKQRKSYEDEID